MCRQFTVQVIVFLVIRILALQNTKSVTQNITYQNIFVTDPNNFQRHSTNANILLLTVDVLSSVLVISNKMNNKLLGINGRQG